MLIYQRVTTTATVRVLVTSNDAHSTLQQCCGDLDVGQAGGQFRGLATQQHGDLCGGQSENHGLKDGDRGHLMTHVCGFLVYCICCKLLWHPSASSNRPSSKSIRAAPWQRSSPWATIPQPLSPTEALARSKWSEELLDITRVASSYWPVSHPCVQTIVVLLRSM